MGWQYEYAATVASHPSSSSRPVWSDPLATVPQGIAMR
jgi:hypothetical protein